jgi:hypothetical protein
MVSNNSGGQDERCLVSLAITLIVILSILAFVVGYYDWFGVGRFWRTFAGWCGYATDRLSRVIDYLTGLS